MKKHLTSINETMKKHLTSIFVFFILGVCHALPRQTDVHNAKHLFDEKGIAYLNIQNVGKTYNPAFVALYALTYAGKENYYGTSLKADDGKFRNGIDWLCDNLEKMPNGLWVFSHDFDSTYLESVTSSSLSQKTGKTTQAKEEKTASVSENLSAILHSSGKAYPGFGIENSLDGDSNDDYTAFYEDSEQVFTLKLSEPVTCLSGILEFENAVNYASEWKVYALDQNEKELAVFSQKDATGQRQSFGFQTEMPVVYLKFLFTKFSGQNRLLLRQISLKKENELTNGTAVSKSSLTIDYSKCDFRRTEASKHELLSRVSCAEVDSETLLFANYANLFLFDKNSGKVNRLQPDFTFSPDKYKNVYIPTGVAIDCDGEVFLANYKGNNILRGRIEGNKIIFTQEYSSRQSIGPENVSVDKKRDILVSANYDGSTATAFQISSGKQLWSAYVGQAHGILIDNDFVYASSLVTRDLQKLDIKTGKLLFRRGSIGWNPAENKYMWPTSIQNLDSEHLIVADAQSGYISKVRKDNLQVVSFFGGNGPSLGQFNYPYSAYKLSDGLYVFSAHRPELLRLSTNPLRAETFWSPFKITAIENNGEKPLGRQWSNYQDLDQSHAISFYDHTYGMGFGKIFDMKTNQEFLVTNIKTLYAARSWLYFLQGRQLSPNCSVFLSSSTTALYAIVELSPQLPALLLNFPIDRDTWLADNGDLICSGQRMPRASLEEIIHDRTEWLAEKLRLQGRLTLNDIVSGAITELDKKNRPLRTMKDSQKMFDKSFTSSEGRKFLWRYNRASNDTASIRKAAMDYYRDLHGVPYLSLEEYFLVGMLSGISPRGISIDDAPFSQMDSTQRLTALSALNTSDLNDYASAEKLADSKFYFSPSSADAKLSRVELIWYSAEEAGRMIRLSGVNPDGTAAILFEGMIDNRNQNGFAVSEISLDSDTPYSKYLFEILKGGSQNRLLLRAFTPDWKKTIDDPLLQFARDVSFKKAYGEGLRSFVSNEELEKAETWHCGNFCVWFARHLPFKYRKIRILDIRAFTGAIHSVVEVVFDEGSKVIDPTLGIVYDSGIRQMLDGSFDFDHDAHYSRMVSSVFNNYYGPQFFYQSKIIREHNMENIKKER